MNDSGCEDTVPSIVSICKLPEESDASMRARLFTSLSQSFPHSQLYKALHGGEDINLNGGDNSEDDDDSLYGDHLSNSCFASLRMDRRDSDDFDDDLQSLEWLQSEDLLKNIGGEKLDKDEEDNEEQKENEDIKPDVAALAEASRQQPIIAPYLPQEHVKSKPPYSFSCLIFMAVEASPQKRLPVKDIYNWILTQFPYFQNAPTGWKNSVRHNLSLNKCFKKVEKDKGQSIGKGSLWCIDPAYRPNLLQALRKTPYHPYHQLQMTSTQPQNYLQYQSLPGGGRTVLPLTQRPVPNTVSPHLFPFLSRRLAQTSFDVDNEMKDVAQTLVALKTSHKIGPTDTSPGEDTGPTWKHHKRSSRRPTSPVVVTEHPYSDHSYSSIQLLEDDVPSPSSSSSIDEEYDFGDAVLSYLLRHTGDSADELFKQLDCSELTYPITDHLFSPHNEECESDYQSDMEWESDDKDEVDGDVRPHRKLKIDLKDSDRESWTVKKVADAESEDDEQKKIHEGASALLNLAGLYRSNSSTSNSPDCGSERKKKEGKNEKKKRSEKRLKLGKKKEEKKLPVSEKFESAEAVKKRKVSKRKNAGSNGKYDSEEYSLIKTTRTPTKNQAGEKPSKTKAVKSPITNKEVSKVSSQPLKAKTSIKATTKSVKKVIDKKKKLKLSKNLCAAKKPAVAVAAEEITGTSGSKLMKTVKKKSLQNKKDGSQSPAATVRKSKSSSDLSAKKVTSSSASKHKEAEGPSSGHTSKGDEPNTGERQQPAVSVKEPTEQQASGFSTILAQTFKGELLSPAGDASSSSFHTVAEGKSAGSKPTSHKNKPEVGSSHTSGNKPSAGDSSKCSEEKSGTPGALTIINASHKSPHFTRFSKKKASMS